MRGGWRTGLGASAHGGRRGTPGGGLGAAAKEAIGAAHAAEAAGRHDEAAERFAEIAARAGQRGMPGVAMHLALQGARNRAQAGHEDAAVADAVVAIGHAAAMVNRSKAANRFGVLVERLRANGKASAADRIDAELRTRLGTAARAAPAATVNRALRRHLPTHCPTCSGPVASDKVQFEDDGSADCAYCGVNLLG